MELREEQDLWPIVRERLLGQIGTLPLERLRIDLANINLDEAEIEAKYRRGEAEHQRDWLDWKAEDFDAAIREELVDLLLYGAMRNVLGC